VRVATDDTIAVRCHACGFSGDVLSLVAAVEQLDAKRDFAAVLKRAGALAGIDVDRGGDDSRPRGFSSQSAKATEPLSSARLDAVLKPLLRMGCLDGALAVDVARYLDRRGLLGETRADGWAALPAAEAQSAWVRTMLDAAEPTAGYSRPFTRAELRSVGLIARAGFEWPEARVCIPWRDPDGLVCNLQRRRLDDGEPRYVGLRGRAFAWPFGVQLVDTAALDAPIAFVEGAVDTLALRALCALGGTAAVVLGVPGVGGWRSSWAALARGRAAAVAFDCDGAGEQHVRRVADDLLAGGATKIERWTPPDGAKDWSEAWQRHVSCDP
jgi:hypothetical protein